MREGPRIVIVGGDGAEWLDRTEPPAQDYEAVLRVIASGPSPATRLPRPASAGPGQGR